MTLIEEFKEYQWNLLTESVNGNIAVRAGDYSNHKAMMKGYVLVTQDDKIYSEDGKKPFVTNKRNAKSIEAKGVPTDAKFVGRRWDQ